MAMVEIWPQGAGKFALEVERVPVEGDYIQAGVLGRVVAVVLTPGSSKAAAVFVKKDQDGWPDEVKNAFS